jgi:hypothetical protein
MRTMKRLVPGRSFQANRRWLSTTTSTSALDQKSSSPPSMLKRVWKSIWEADDSEGATLRAQERKDLFHLILITKLRQVRMDNPDMDYREAFDQAYNELDKKGLDDMSNVLLRIEMQDMLSPQVLDVLESFRRVDTSIQPEIFQEDALMSGHDYNDYKAVIRQDYEETATRLENLRVSRDNNNNSSPTKDALAVQTQRSISFLERKLGALTCLLDFHSWKDGAGGDWATATDFDSEMDDFGFRVTTADEETFVSIRQYQTINMYRSALLKKELGYSIIAMKSFIPGAGRGVFVDGVAMAGSLVAFQPGPVWPLGSVRPDVEDHFHDNHNLQLSMRYDNFIIDSRRSPYTVLTRPQSNPLSLGHVVNHPQAGSLPNCQSLMLNFLEGMQLGDLYRYVPNTYAVPPTWINRTFDRYVIEMHSMCLLARRDVQEEELVYDYRLTGTDMPRWYHKIDYPED